MDADKPEGPLRKGWTTGACATAAAAAAYQALLTGAFPDPVTVALPRGAARMLYPSFQDTFWFYLNFSSLKGEGT